MLLARPDSETPQYRLLKSLHETFARTAGTALATFLQAEISAALEGISFAGPADFLGSLTAPGCFVRFELHPRPEQAILSLDCVTVFSLLELLLGGSGSQCPEPRVLTDIEWSLLEEVVRLLVRPLGESWKAFHPVEFNVQSLESDPAVLSFPAAASQLLVLRFTLRFGEQSGAFQIAVPHSFFELEGETAQEQPAEAGEVQRNLALLGDAQVDVEVVLDGPTMLFQDLAGVAPGEVIRFDYPLEKPVRAVVNREISFPCLIVSAGRKRAFQVEDLP